MDALCLRSDVISSIKILSFRPHALHQEEGSSDSSRGGESPSPAGQPEKQRPTSGPAAASPSSSLHADASARHSNAASHASLAATSRPGADGTSHTRNSKLRTLNHKL